MNARGSKGAPGAGGAGDIAIVGAGITGLSIAWHLAREQAGAVTLYDGSGVGAGATAIQPGGVRQQWASTLACTMARESLAFYQQVDTLLEPEVPPTLDQCGYLFVAESAAELAVLRERVAIQRAAGVPSQLLDPQQAEEIVPGLPVDSLTGAAFCGQDGYFDRPQAVVAAFAKSAQQMGVELVTEFVRSLARDGDGWRLQLADGTTQRAARVVVAAAQSSATLVHPLGVELPIEQEARHLFYSDPVRERLLEPLVISSERHFAAKQLADGSVLASDLSAVGDPADGKSNWHSHVRRTITALLPILEYVSFPVMVTGLYDVTPDAQPILGPVDGCDGLWVAAGLNGRGFMMAPVIGRFIAQSICGSTEEDPMRALSPQRFATGELIHESQVV
jgi:sarcosine oxidase subunit beta